MCSPAAIQPYLLMIPLLWWCESGTAQVILVLLLGTQLGLQDSTICVRSGYAQ